MATDETQAERRLRGVREFIGLLSQDEMDALDIGRDAIKLLRQLRARRGGACVACGVIASSRSGPCCEWAGAYRALLARATGEGQ